MTRRETEETQFGIWRRVIDSMNYSHEALKWMWKGCFLIIHKHHKLSSLASGKMESGLPLGSSERNMFFYLTIWQ